MQNKLQTDTESFRDHLEKSSLTRIINTNKSETFQFDLTKKQLTHPAMKPTISMLIASSRVLIYR